MIDDPANQLKPGVKFHSAFSYNLIWTVVTIKPARNKHDGPMIVCETRSTRNEFCTRIVARVCSIYDAKAHRLFKARRRLLRRL